MKNKVLKDEGRLALVLISWYGVNLIRHAEIDSECLHVCRTTGTKRNSLTCGTTPRLSVTYSCASHKT